MAKPKVPVKAAAKASSGQRMLPEAGSNGVGRGLADPPTPEAKSASWYFGFKALVTTAGGGLLTLIFTLAQISYSTHLAVLQRQAEQGVEFQNRLADITGRIENEFIDILDLESSRAPDLVRQARARLDTNLNELFRNWRLVRLNLRSRAAQIYGPEVGNLIYNPNQEMIRLDRCYVATRIDDPARNSDCPGRGRREGFRLAALVRISRLRPGDHVLLHTGWAPSSFQANARLLREVFEHYIKCRLIMIEDSGTPAPSRCANMDDMGRIVTSRLDLLAITREEISTAIMERSTLQD
jgi:hypothetical protein